MKIDSFSIKKCPLGLDCKRFLSIVAKGESEKAIDFLRRTIPFPGIIGSLCPAPCSRFFPKHLPAISEFESFLYNHESEQKGRPHYFLEELPKTGEKIAIVGAGASGLICAHDLARIGHHVEVFERHAKPGGILDTAISSSVLPRHILFSEMDILRKLGVKFNFGVNIGKDILLNTLSIEFDAVYLATGAYSRPSETIEQTENCVDVLEFSENFDKYSRFASHLTIIGGDNASFSLAIRLSKAGKVVSIVTPIPIEKMKISQSYLDFAVHNSIELLFLHSVETFLQKGNEIEALELRRLPACDILEESIITHKTDFVVLSTKRSVEDMDFNQYGLTLNKFSLIDVDQYYSTNIAGIFAGGDAIRFDNDFLSVFTDGRKAACNIQRFLVSRAIVQNDDKLLKIEPIIRENPALSVNIPKKRQSLDPQKAKILAKEIVEKAFQKPINHDFSTDTHLID